MSPEIDRIFWLADGVKRYGHYALGGLVALCLMSGNYLPLMDAAGERYLESRGKALWQLQARSQAAKTALLAVLADAEQVLREVEERRLQREAEVRRALEEQQRQAFAQQQQAQMQEGYRQSYTRNLAEFNALVGEYRKLIVWMHEHVTSFESNSEEAVRKPDFFRGGAFSVADVSTSAPCSNPGSLGALLDLDGNRKHNLAACAIYYASSDRNARSNPPHRHVISAIYMRTMGNDRDNYTLPRIFVYHWYMQIVNAANQGSYPGSPPSLFDSGELSNRLLGSSVDSGFTALLNKTTTSADMLLLRDTIHPDMSKLASLAQQMTTACRALGIPICVPAIIRW